MFIKGKVNGTSPCGNDTRSVWLCRNYSAFWCKKILEIQSGSSSQMECTYDHEPQHYQFLYNQDNHQALNNYPSIHDSSTAVIRVMKGT